MHVDLQLREAQKRVRYARQRWAMARRQQERGEASEAQVAARREFLVESLAALRRIAEKAWGGALKLPRKLLLVGDEPNEGGRNGQGNPR